MNRRLHQRSARSMINAIFSMCKPSAAQPLAADSALCSKTGDRSATPSTADARAACGIRCCANRCAPWRAGGLSPNVAIIDSQPVKTISKGGAARGYDAGKKIKGGKRHIAIKNTMELPLTVAVHSAGIQARDLQARLRMHFEGSKTIFGPCLAGECRRSSAVSSTPSRYCPKCWIVGRAFIWLSYSRGLSRGYEVAAALTEVFVKSACIRRMPRRLA